MSVPSARPGRGRTYPRQLAALESRGLSKDMCLRHIDGGSLVGGSCRCAKLSWLSLRTVIANKTLHTRVALNYCCLHVCHSCCAFFSMHYCLTNLSCADRCARGTHLSIAPDFGALKVRLVGGKLIHTKRVPKVRSSEFFQSIFINSNMIFMQ